MSLFPSFDPSFLPKVTYLPTDFITYLLRTPTSPRLYPVFLFFALRVSGPRRFVTKCQDLFVGGCSDLFPSLSLSSFSLPLRHSTSSLTPVDASPRQSVTFRAPRGRHPTRALTPQTPGGGGREDAILCLCRRGWFREVDKMLNCFAFAPFWRPF